MKISQRLALQIVIGFLAMLSIFGPLTMFFSIAFMMEKPPKAEQMIFSNLCHMGGISMTIGILLLRSLPNIDHDGADLRRISLLTFVGGLGRLCSFTTLDLEIETVVATLFELFAFPLICLWQYRLQQTSLHSHVD